ncbi:GNAT family N-acetyltransferase [Pontibacillus marinus]|uniref:Acetyltransferase n=1 Tax=Pontibacillus marinus BH030004 = DSM 16465 TaxID=1385511 RepID=A0A0A5GD98_9BACI|nr:GNAT family N-acetyltransferase [Pontibacillus marinus]KGX91196.1 acetyltransferase [Pontibacillus marinus BH030004 = DSM 16465]
MKVIEWNKKYVSELVDLWNTELGNEYPMREELFLQNSFQDKNLLKEGSFIGLEEDRLIGFVISKRWQETLDVAMSTEVGWIQACVIHNDFQDQGVGTALLKRAEVALWESGVTKIHMGSDPWHYFPGVPTTCEKAHYWMSKNNYQKGVTEYDLLNDGKGVFTYPSHFENVEFKLLNLNHKQELVDFLHKNFPGRWEYEALHYFNRKGTGREFIVATKNDKIIGFCRINDSLSPFIAQNVYWSPLFEKALGGIGPLGVTAQERGNGYGDGLVQAAIYFLRDRGIQNIVIDWTGLVDFYKKFHFEPWKLYVSYSKEREE